MAEKNSGEIVAVPAVEAADLVASTHLAVGMQLPTMQAVFRLVAEETAAPHFPAAAEPVSDGVAHTAADGRMFYRPQLRVARRSGGLGPEVWFLKDEQGVVRLQFELEEAPIAGLPAGAVPFPVQVDAIRLEWNGGVRAFAPPALQAAESPAEGAPRFVLRVGAVLDPEEVGPLKDVVAGRNGSQARIVADLSYGYWLDAPDTDPVPPGDPDHGFPIETGHGFPIEAQFERPIEGEFEFHGVERGPFARQPRRHALEAPQAVMPALRAEMAAAPGMTRFAASAREGLARAPRVIARGDGRATPPLLRAHLDILRADGIQRVFERARRREAEPGFRRVVAARSVPFSFDPDLEEHRAIYRGITGDPVLGEAWRNTGSGWARAAGFANTLFRIPDELRLAYNEDLGTPFFVPTVYQDARGENRVRVLLRATPWHDPEDLVRLRDAVGSAPRIVAGGYEKATLRMTGAFPEQIVLAAEEVAIDLRGGVELALDVTLEFYSFLAGIVKGPIGVTGDVRVVLETSRAADGTASVNEQRVPMRLTFDDLGALPVSLGVPADVISPRDVEVVNRAAAPLTLTGCVPRLLQYDPNSVLPLATYRAACTAAFPQTIPPGQSVRLPIQPSDDGLLWNAVQVELLGQELEQDPAAALDRIHEIAPQGTLKWTIAVECPLFARSPVPAQWDDLHRLEVEIRRDGFKVQEVTLGRDRPATTITMERSLKDMLAPDAAGVGSFSYRVRNVYVDHLGKWSEDRTEEGSSLFAFPNPRNGD